MALEIAQLGQPVLRLRSTPLPVDEIKSKEFQAFLDDMLLALQSANGAGLAAPQVFSSKRVFLAGVLPSSGSGRAPGVEIFINPKLSNLSTEKAWEWEGCLSFIELLVYVPRHERLRVEYINRDGEPRSLDLEGFPARVVQHEYDHLDGVLTIDRADSTRDIVKASEIDAVMKARGEKPD